MKKVKSKTVSANIHRKFHVVLPFNPLIIRRPKINYFKRAGKVPYKNIEISGN